MKSPNRATFEMNCRSIYERSVLLSIFVEDEVRYFCEKTTLDFRVRKTLRSMKWYLNQVCDKVGGLNG